MELDARGNVKAPLYATDEAGVFACGDARMGQSLVVTAIAEGRRCAPGGRPLPGRVRRDAQRVPPRRCSPSRTATPTPCATRPRPRRTVTVGDAFWSRPPRGALAVETIPPVDAERDHVRGHPHAPVTLVEYGDFQCPDCGYAYPVVEELLARFGHQLRFVFRHMPLNDLHPRAEAAAEAAEAAGAQGRFWEMHDRLFTHQPAERRELRAMRRRSGWTPSASSASCGSAAMPAAWTRTTAAARAAASRARRGSSSTA